MTDDDDLYAHINEIFNTHFEIVHCETECIPIPCSMVEDTILNNIQPFSTKRKFVCEFLESEGVIRGTRPIFVKNIEEYFPSIDTDICQRVKNRCSSINVFHPQRLECYLNIRCMTDEPCEELESIKYSIVEYLSELRSQIRSQTSIHELYTLNKKLAHLVTSQREVGLLNDTQKPPNRVKSLDITVLDTSFTVECRGSGKGLYEGVYEEFRVRLYDDDVSYVADILGCAEDDLYVERIKGCETYPCVIIESPTETFTTYTLTNSNTFLDDYVSNESDSTIRSFEDHGMLMYCEHQTKGFYIGIVNENIQVEETHRKS